MKAWQAEEACSGAYQINEERIAGYERRERNWRGVTSRCFGGKMASVLRRRIMEVWAVHFVGKEGNLGSEGLDLSKNHWGFCIKERRR